MKKLILSVALVLGSLTTFAQASAVSKTETTKTEVTKTVQEKYTEIKTAEVPDAVKTALKTAYPDATLSRAYVNDKKEYKLELTVGDQNATVYADANGNWIKK